MLPTWLWAWIGLFSGLALLLALVDKRSARRGRRRIPERTLLGVALVGGSPGLVLGMLLAHHKTRKGSFLAGLALVLAAQALAAWLVLR